jgi:hypothetical protein
MVQALPARMLALMRAGDGGAAPSSPAQRALGILAVLARIDGGIIDAVPHPGADAILTAEQQAELVSIAASKGSAEKGVVRYMTPVIAALRGCTSVTDARVTLAPVLVNSELLQWLEHPAGRGLAELRLKPDLFRSWAPFVEERAGGEGQGEGPGYDFGVLGSAALQHAGAVAEVYEAKGSALTRSDFGELCAYHDALGRGVCRGVLFGPRAFWLYKTVNASPLKLIRACWTDGGSADTFRDFFEHDADDELDAPEPPLLVLLRTVLARLDTMPTVAADGRCYLGSGATGHVFSVRAPAGEPPRALKVVLAANAVGIGAEYARMLAAAAAGAPVVPPVAGSLTIVGTGGAFLLARVGAAAPATSALACSRAFAALAALHGAGVTHGDARLANLLVVDGELRWIDLLGGAAAERATPAFDALARSDAETLARSFLQAAAPAVLPAAVQEALSAYIAEETTAVKKLAVAVWAVADTV